MNLVPWRKSEPEVEERDLSYTLPFQEYVNLFYNGVGYNITNTQTLTGASESISADFTGLIRGAYQANGIVFACMLTRMLHFVQARFMFQRLRNGRPGELWGNEALGLLEVPWLNGTTMDLLGRMITDVDLAGNFYAVRQGDRLHRLRPDWTYIVLGSTSKRDSWEPGDPDTDVIGYQYQPGGLYSGRDPYFYLPEQVAHWAPMLDPLAEYRGMSWLTPILRDVQADVSMTNHRQKFFDQGATVNHVVKVPAATVEAFDKWVERLDGSHRGLANAYKTVYLGAGADMQAIGSNMQQVDFATTQGAGEVRIAIAARVPATIIGINEGLKGSTLNAGNYQSARRQFADELLRPYWAGAAAALASIMSVPGGSRLWYDDRDIAFLKEDVKDAADVLNINSNTMHNLIAAGFKPDSVISAVSAQDLTLLVHTGLFSVQLQPAGSITQGKGAVVQGTPVPASSGTQ